MKINLAKQVLICLMTVLAFMPIHSSNVMHSMINGMEKVAVAGTMSAMGWPLLYYKQYVDNKKKRQKKPETKELLLHVGTAVCLGGCALAYGAS